MAGLEPASLLAHLNLMVNRLRACREERVHRRRQACLRWSGVFFFRAHDHFLDHDRDHEHVHVTVLVHELLHRGLLLLKLMPLNGPHAFVLSAL